MHSGDPGKLAINHEMIFLRADFTPLSDYCPGSQTLIPVNQRMIVKRYYREQTADISQTLARDAVPGQSANIFQTKKVALPPNKLLTIGIKLDIFYIPI